MVQHLGGLSNELYAGWHHAVKKGSDEVFVRCIDSGGQGIEPGQHEGPPAKHVRLHVDHTTARHLPQTYITSEHWYLTHKGISIYKNNIIDAVYVLTSEQTICTVPRITR